MGDLATTGVSNAAKTARWAARGLSALVLLFWGFFLVASFFGGESEASRPLSARDYVGLVTMGLWLIGLVIAWKWELLGGVVVLVAYVSAGVANTSVFSLPFLIIPTAAVLFLASWWLRRSSHSSDDEIG